MRRWLAWLINRMQSHQHTGADGSGLLGTGVVISSMILDGTIATGDMAAGSASTVLQTDSGGTVQWGTVTSAMITDGTIVNGDINASAAIAYSKLSLTGSIVNADISASAAIDTSKLAGYADTTWTPVIAGDGTAGTNTYTTQAGYYVRLGNVVFATFQVTLSALGAGPSAMVGNIYVSLPVTVRNSSNLLFSGALRASNITIAAGYTWLTCTPVANTTRAFIQRSGTGAAVANIVAADIAATTSVVGTVVYFA